MSGSWFRVPAWVGGRLCGGHVAQDREAWVDLLGRWHAGEDVSASEFCRACKWGKGRTLAFMPKVAEWAVESGATVPNSWRARILNGNPGTDRKRTGANEEEPTLTEDSGPQTDRFRTVRARAPLSGEEKEMEIEGCESALADTSAPPPTEPPEADPPEEPLDLPALLDGDQRLIAPLVAEGILTVEHLEAQTAASLRFVEGIGPKRAKAIQAALQAHGRDLRPEPTRKRARDVERPGLQDLTDRWARAYQHVMGAAYAWTQGGRTSDSKASREIYDAFGWSAEPSAEVVADAAATVRRYLAHCRAVSRVPTLHDLAQGLARFRQDDRLVKASRRVPVSNQRRAEEERVEAMRDLLADLPFNLETIDA